MVFPAVPLWFCSETKQLFFFFFFQINLKQLLHPLFRNIQVAHGISGSVGACGRLGVYKLDPITLPNPHRTKPSGPSVKPPWYATGCCCLVDRFSSLTSIRGGTEGGARGEVICLIHTFEWRGGRTLTGMQRENTEGVLAVGCWEWRNVGCLNEDLLESTNCPSQSLLYPLLFCTLSLPCVSFLSSCWKICSFLFDLASLSSVD